MADLSELLRSISVSLPFMLAVTTVNHATHAYTIIIYSYALVDVEIDIHARGKSKYRTLKRYCTYLYLVSEVARSVKSF